MEEDLEKPTGKIYVRIKIGNNELELSGAYGEVYQLIQSLIPYLVGGEGRQISIETHREEPIVSELPDVRIKSGEPLTQILTKFFSTEWGRKPRQLKEIINLLESYGVYYPKSTIAVSLKRLVQRGVIRRIKGREKHYLYVSANVSVGEVD